MVSRPVIDSSLLYRAESKIAQNALTNSKNPDCLMRGAYPTHAVKGNGAILTDSLGNEYFDYICGLGTNLLGYAHIDLTRSIHDEICKGLSYSISGKIEVEAAEKLNILFPWVERIKFLKTGTEACNASIRIARAYTQRDYILTDGYHGWGDEFTSITPPASGVPSSPFIHKFETIEQINKNVAAVIIEPVQLNDSIERIRFLNRLRERCDDTGTVLIFDEIITGLRYQKFSVSNNYTVYPDILLLGKSLAGGLPLSVVCGKKELMDNPKYFVSGTFAGENASLRAMMKIIELLWNKTHSIKELWSWGKDFIDQFNSIWPEKIWLNGYATRARFEGDKDVIHMFWQESIGAGLLFGPSWFYCFPHMEYQYRVINLIREILNNIKSGNVTLWAQRPKSPFSARARE